MSRENPGPNGRTLDEPLTRSTAMKHALSSTLLFERSRLQSGQAQVTHAVVRLEATGRPDRKRPPLDLLACIDVSGSMAGEKIESVRRSLYALSRELGAEDRLGITSFESSVRQVLPPTRMDMDGKARLRSAVEQMRDLGSTFMSGGLLGAVSDLKAVPPLSEQAVRRVLLFTDGHANEGIGEDDRAGWTGFLAQHLGGLSVSWFGFGEDHDAEFLAWLADQCRGNAYVARDADAIADGFAQELGGLLGVRAMQVEVEICTSGATAKLLNDERTTECPGGFRVQLDDLSCEERRELAVELSVPASRPRSSPVSVEIQVRWRDAVTGDAHQASLAGQVSFSSGRVPAAKKSVREVVALVAAAAAQVRARAFAEQGRFRDAADAIREAVAQLSAVGTPRSKTLAQQLERLVEDYANVRRYSTSKSKLMAMQRAMSKQRSSGSEADELFLTPTKHRMVSRFREEEPGDGAQTVDPAMREQLEEEMVARLRSALSRARVLGPRRRSTP